MAIRQYAIRRLEQFLEEVGRVEQSEFPYPHSRDALKRLEATFTRRLQRLRGLSDNSDPDVVRNECALALEALFRYLPLLGFILRSTNVRNAFEAYGPLLRLAGDLLEPDTSREKRETRLLLSSEWEYSPFTYREITDLPGFVLIGLPAPESANPLLLPCAGHELGHTLWAKRRIYDKISGALRQAILTLSKERWSRYVGLFPNVKEPDELTATFYGLESWEKTYQWSVRQAEESFCDYVGIRLFGSSYLKAFAYLVGPKFAGKRSVRYPQLRERARDSLTALRKYYGAKADIDSADYEGSFEDMSQPDLTSAEEFQLEIADTARRNLVAALISYAGEEVARANLPLADNAKVNQIRDRLKLAVPAEKAASLTDILNAAWVVFEDSTLWADAPALLNDRDHVVKELVLKSLEVFEIEQIQGGGL